MEAIGVNGNGGKEDQTMRERKHVDQAEANGGQHGEDDSQNKSQKTYGRTPDGTGMLAKLTMEYQLTWDSLRRSADSRHGVPALLPEPAKERF